MVRVTMKDRARARVLALLDQLMAERDLTEHAAAKVAALDPSYAHKLRTGERDSIGHRQLEAIVKKLGLEPNYFTDPALGDRPDYRKHLAASAGGELLERDEDLSHPEIERALADEGLLDAAERGDPAALFVVGWVRDIDYTGGADTADYAEGLHQIARGKAAYRARLVRRPALKTRRAKR